jgi:hypothetical protein
MLIDLEVPDGLHPETRNLVAGFAKALAEKLYAAEKKYGYSDGWRFPDWEQECRAHFSPISEKAIHETLRPTVRSCGSTAGRQLRNPLSHILHPTFDPIFTS